MARVTVEDCLEREENRFALVVLAAQRTRQIMKGNAPLVQSKNKAAVTALREIAAGKVHYDRSSHDAVAEYIEVVTRREFGLKKKRDRELEVCSLAHYEDPAYYTSNYADRVDDVAFYVALARKAGGPVLEYGVGNGRVALPIARHGVEVVGIDHSAPMLADLRARLSREPADVRGRVRAVRADMRKARLGRRFPLVVATFNTVLHLYTRGDVEQFLARVREHLAPGGRFVADLSVPLLEQLTRRASRPYRAPRFLHPTAGVVVKNTERFEYDSVRQVMFVSMEFEPVDDADAKWVTPFAHRQFFPQEWEALLHYNGFEVDRVEGDYSGGPLQEGSDVMVWHARKRRS